MEAAERKLHILQCAKKLFAKNGFFNTQISDIIHEAGIARGTVYQYFKNKDDIFITLVESFYREYENRVSTKLSGIDLMTITHVDYFRIRIKETLIFFASDQELCKIIFRKGLGISNSFDPLIKGFEKRINDIFLSDLNLGIKADTIRTDVDLDIMLHILTGAVIGIAYQYFGTDNSKNNLEQVDFITDEIVKVISPGLFKK